jgi:translocation and assembly module TamB
MKKGLFTFVMVMLGLYLTLHLVLGSSPVQRRVVDEIRRALSGYGLDLQIESIEFSAFTPKIYLNRVTLRSLPKSKISLPNPIQIDKIKIEFQPIALISKRLVIEEATLFHPRLLIPNADTLYRRVTSMLGNHKAPEVQGGFFKLVVKKIGVVDALFDISSAEPAFTLRSRSLSAFVQNNVSGQQTITVDSHNLELVRQALNLNLTSLALDIDLTKRSIRVNRAIIESDQMAINVKGVSAVPEGNEKLPSTLNASYDFKIPVSLLNKIPELKVPELDGLVSSAGTVALANGTYSGSGTLRYDDLFVTRYRIGRGALTYSLSEKKVLLSNIDLRYGGGELTSKLMTIELKDRYPIAGELTLKAIHLEDILDSLKSPDSPVRFGTSGTMVVKGALGSPFEVTGEIKGKFEDLEVVDDPKKKSTPDNSILLVKNGDLGGKLRFLLDKMEFQAAIQGLEGTLTGEGFVDYDNNAKVITKGNHLSLTGLKHIAELQVGGWANLNSEVTVTNGHAKITGDFDVTNGEISDIFLGSVKGQAYFENMLLSFENLEATTSLEPVKGNGFVDFKPVHTHYRFNVDGRRLLVDDAFRSFQKLKLKFPQPSHGEVSARLTIEGGHDDKGMEIAASGQAKNFKWYDEQWLSSSFSALFRSGYTDITRLILFKKSGGLELKAHLANAGAGGNVGESRSSLSFISHGLRLEELNHLGNAPLAGELAGQLSLEGDLSNPSGSGNISASNVMFRGVPLPDSTFKVTTDEGQMQIMANLFGETLRGRLAKNILKKGLWQVLLYFEKFDAAPLLTMLMGKDIPTLNRIDATGDISLEGDLNDWQTLKGSGALSQIEVGLKGTPMRNVRPVSIQVNKGTVKIDRFSLIGKESELTLDFMYSPSQSVRASLDGKIDLQFVQPFIPGVEYGSGKVAAGLRLSGKPNDFSLLGNVSLEDGSFRITGIRDEFRNAQVQLSLSQDRINVDHLEANVNGGLVNVEGEVHIDKFRTLSPNLKLTADRVVMRTANYLTTKFSGDFAIRGNAKPYTLSGKCRVIEANLTRFDAGTEARDTGEPPILKLDVNCEAKEKLFVKTDVMSAEFKGNFHLLGNNNEIGLLGSAEAVRGSILFRERNFTLNSGNVKFESPDRIAPRFSVGGRAIVQEQTSSNQPNQLQASQQYEVNLQVYGTPASYKIILTSNPELAEADIISLLVLGVTSRGQDNNFMDLGTTLVGQIPLQSQLENQLGVDIRINTQTSKNTSTSSATTSTPTTTSDTTVPSVKIQKDITNRTKVSYSNTLEAIPYRELKIEHMLDDNLTVNGTAVDRAKGGTDATTTQSYGLDFRYRFQFE